MFEAKKFTDYDLHSVENILPVNENWTVTLGADKKSIVCRHGEYSANMFVIEYDKRIKDYVFSGVNIPSTTIGELTECLRFAEDSPKRITEKYAQ